MILNLCVINGVGLIRSLMRVCTAYFHDMSITFEVFVDDLVTIHQKQGFFSV